MSLTFYVTIWYPHMPFPMSSDSHHHDLLICICTTEGYSVQDVGQSILAEIATRRRRWFVRDKLQCVNQRSLINLRFCGAARRGRHRVCANWHGVVIASTTSEAGQHAGRSLLQPVAGRSVANGRWVFRTTFWMIIGVDGWDAGRWEMCTGRTHLTFSRNPSV